MLGLKKAFIRNQIKLTVTKDIPGQFQVKINNLKNITPDLKQYEQQAKQILRLLDGIEQIEVDYEQDRVSIGYNTHKLQVEEIKRWIEVVTDVCIDQIDFIKAHYEQDLDCVIETLSCQLKRYLK